ncbi:MAG TPA: 2,3-bisphosphoglycerate-independent phosphoglycerate mutase [Oligoflexia bacterium]|nr:2,3-bisphosphoglycerate-independent phosphoglycerate mutase [Oligoflexia bacterium]HMP26760.1 2,3-bisphosphoglycerate-independent phosphoglycerate mutase [Oligoflexia bacterium]
MKFPVVLSILDGFGINPDSLGNAVYLSNPKNFKELFANFPSATLATHGESVGLPAGQMGGSEVGHLNIGAGRIVEQTLLRISRAFANNYLDNSAEYLKFIKSAAKNSVIHLIGLLSDGGIHSHIDHLFSLLSKMCRDFSGDIFIHIIGDGRDTPPSELIKYINSLEQKIISLNRPNLKIASLSGRFYAMDRDNRWERTEKAWRAIHLAEPKTNLSLNQYVQLSYQKGVTDEFIEPTSFIERQISSTDLLCFWNFRGDRMRQLVDATISDRFINLSAQFSPFTKDRLLLMTEYDQNLNLPTLFQNQEINDHLGEVISKAGLKQIRIAETEKYPHVTYFFNGGREEVCQNEKRVLLPSPREIKTYDLKPEMSAVAVLKETIAAIESGEYDFVLVNFANCDMVGHTGSLEAAIKACATVDWALGELKTAIERAKGVGLIIADHGNAEQMIDYASGKPHTAHTTFPVPVILYDPNNRTGCERLRPDGALCDIAPTILKIMKISQPTAMTGKSLY